MNTHLVEHTVFKASEQIDKIISLLKQQPFYRQYNFAKGKHLSDHGIWGGQHVLIIEQGSVSIQRVSSGKMMAICEAPNMIGIGELLLNQRFHEVVAETDIVMAYAPYDDFVLFLRENHLWKDICYVLSAHAQVLYSRLANTDSRRAYNIVKTYLIELEFMSPDFRQSIAVWKYLQNLTVLSRSAIMSILSELRNQKCIEMKDGKLLKINRLPDELIAQQVQEKK
ncbi:helix-turn-helix domain-containing protein [Hafnia paralvei]|uniref:helix-turn-helix domain-containing protein n=1 Tax=Hafnia paralvei TaxID=546367 RepID=UPI0026DD55E7|nr:helix-turn-helix domain-containing protein [Hafnia paralvei]MDX6909237.1 helix-turn-helix domain-containing protein [Hafnia paralvei]